jgi:hypothetical protein
MDGLIQPPVFGQPAPAENIHRPHAIELQQYPLRLIAAVYLLEKIGVQPLLVLDGDETAVALGQELLVVLLLAVFTHEQDGALAVVEIVHVQGVAEQGGFPAVQKTGD